jgi:hypothetical protein
MDLSRMERRDLVRGFVLAAICLGLLVYNWGFLAWPAHRVMALMVMAAVFSFAWFYELTMRDAPMGWVLTGVLTIIGGAVVLWAGLTLFARPLPDDAAPLMAAGDTLDMQGCAVPPRALTVAVGADRITSRGRGPFVPFTVSGCAGPSLVVTPQGLVVSDFGYDGDGSVAFTLRHNLFQRLMGDWLHLHRPDRSTLGIYDQWENEILYVRYLGAATVRVRGRFLCGEYPPVVVKGASVTVGDSRHSQPDCLLDRPRRY